MTLDRNDLRRGLEFIVGEWRPEYVVNAFSDDLAHIPAGEFKTEDGRDFTAILFDFTEDHSVVLRDSSQGIEIRGSWEQTDIFEYHYTMNGFFDLPDGALRENAEKLIVQDGRLVFSIGFLAVALHKTAEGNVTEQPDISKVDGDPSLTDIVGVYEVAQTKAFIDGEFKLFDRNAVSKDLEKRLSAGEIEEDEVREGLRGFEMLIEFTADHKILTWMPIPDGVSGDEINAAIEAGEVKSVKDGLFALEEKEWKAVDGKYYYDTGEHRETFGEVQSSWDELTCDGEGLLNYASGLMKLKKV